MSTSCGFFNSLNRDRLYNASHFGHCFDGIILSGILASIGDCFVVKAATGMTVNVGSGKSWYLGSWLENDADLPVPIEQSDMVLSRIDAIVMEFNMTENVRWNDVKVVKGEPSSVPTRPALTNTKAIVQIPLAYISIRANASSISQSDITNVVGTDECPFVSGILKTVSTSTLLMQWTAEFHEMLDASEIEMNAVLEAIQKELASLEAGTAVELKKLQFTNTVVPAASFVADTTYPDDYPYRASVQLDGVLASMIPYVTFSVSDAISGNFAPVAETYNGGVYIYASNVPEANITIPTIVCWRGNA